MVHYVARSCLCSGFAGYSIQEDPFLSQKKHLWSVSLRTSKFYWNSAWPLCKLEDEENGLKMNLHSSIFIATGWDIGCFLMFKFSKPFIIILLLCGYCNEKNSPNTLNDLLLTSSNSRGVGVGGGWRATRKLLHPYMFLTFPDLSEQTEPLRPQKNKPFWNNIFSAFSLPLLLRPNLTLFGLYFSYETMTTKKKKAKMIFLTVWPQNLLKKQDF